MTTENARLRRWLVKMVEVGEADDADCKAWMAEAALNGWSVQDWEAAKIPTETGKLMLKEETKVIPATRDRVVTLMLGETSRFFGGTLLQATANNPQETAHIRKLMERLYDCLVLKGLIERVPNK